MSTIYVEDLATIIYTEFLNEGSDDRIFPIVDLLTIGHLKERVETHLLMDGRGGLSYNMINIISKDVKRIIIQKVEILLKGWKSK